MIQKVLICNATMLRLKSMFFCQFALLSTNVITMSYLGGIYWESWFSWFEGGVQEELTKSKKIEKGKTLKMKRMESGEYRESQITTIYHFGFTFYIKSYILLVVYTITLYLQLLCVSGYLNCSNDTRKFI